MGQRALHLTLKRSRMPCTCLFCVFNLLTCFSLSSVFRVHRMKLWDFFLFHVFLYLVLSKPFSWWTTTCFLFLFLFFCLSNKAFFPPYIFMKLEAPLKPGIIILTAIHSFPHLESSHSSSSAFLITTCAVRMLVDKDKRNGFKYL